MPTAPGATVYAFVTLPSVGETLHRLEVEAEVFLLGRKRLPHLNCERWLLRSDQFPAGWEGFEVVLNVTAGEEGIDSFTPVLRLEG